MSYEYLSLEEYEKKFGKLKRSAIGIDRDILPNERETSIIMDDESDDALIFSAQKAIVKKLLFDIKGFKLDDDGICVKDGRIISVSGVLPKDYLKFYSKKKNGN